MRGCCGGGRRGGSPVCRTMRRCEGSRCQDFTVQRRGCAEAWLGGGSGVRWCGESSASRRAVRLGVVWARAGLRLWRGREGLSCGGHGAGAWRRDGASESTGREHGGARSGRRHGAWRTGTDAESKVHEGRTQRARCTDLDASAGSRVLEATMRKSAGATAVAWMLPPQCGVAVVRRRATEFWCGARCELLSVSRETGAVRGRGN
jgi:hypothetical protein